MDTSTSARADLTTARATALQCPWLVLALLLQQTGELEDYTYVEGSQLLSEEVPHPLLPPSDVVPTQTKPRLARNTVRLQKTKFDIRIWAKRKNKYMPVLFSGFVFHRTRRTSRFGSNGTKRCAKFDSKTHPEIPIRRARHFKTRKVHNRGPHGARPNRKCNSWYAV